MRTHHRLRLGQRLAAAGVIAGLGLLSGAAGLTAQAASVPTSTTLRAAVAKELKHSDVLSSGLRTWLAVRPSVRTAARQMATPSIGSNVDANDPALDLAARQSETAIAGQRRGTSALVLAGWNDISGALADPHHRSRISHRRRAVP